MKHRIALLIAVSLLVTHELEAWGPEGHRIIGRAAFELLDDTARSTVLDLLGDPLDEAGIAREIDLACNWPDRIRDQATWAWTSPLHYVNIPRHTDRYDRSRDCPDGRCVTEGILDFANRLAYPEFEKKKRWQAFAFVCHLIGDLHQPLHAGFRDDRGANTVDITYRDENLNLHQFWDGVLVRERLEDEDAMVDRLVAAGRERSTRDWNASEVREWTDESHAIARDNAYPPESAIDDDFADRSWIIVGERWELAVGRMAQVLNATIGENAVTP